MLSLIWRFSGSMASTWAFTIWPTQYVLRMVDAAVGDDFADVDEAFDAFGELHERAEFHHAGDRAFDRRADGKLLRHFSPGIAERLLEPREMRRSSG